MGSMGNSSTALIQETYGAFLLDYIICKDG